MNPLRTRAPILALAFASILVAAGPLAAGRTQARIPVSSRIDGFPRCGNDVTLQPVQLTASPQSEPPAPISSSDSAGATEDINVGGMIRRIPLLVWIGSMLLVWMTFYIPGVFVKRWIAYGVTAHYSKAIESDITLAVRSRRWQAALETCRTRAKSPFAKMAEPALEEMKCAGRITLLSLESVRVALTRSGFMARSEIKRPMRNLMSVSIVAPMTGLLIGIVEAENAMVDMAVSEGASERRLLSGLAEGLIALAIGILIGIAAHLTHRFALGWSSRLENRLALFESDLLAAYLTSRRTRSSVTARPFPRSVTFLKSSAHRRSAKFAGTES